MIKNVRILSLICLSTLLLSACEGVPKNLKGNFLNNAGLNLDLSELSSKTLSIPTRATLNPIPSQVFLNDDLVDINVSWNKSMGINGHTWTVLLNNQQILPFFPLKAPKSLGDEQQSDRFNLPITQAGAYSVQVKLCQNKSQESLCSLSLAHSFEVFSEQADVHNENNNNVSMKIL